MSRGFPTAVATALAQQNVAIVTFAKLEFPSGTVYVHNSLGSYTWGGHDWLGVGDLGSISQVEEGLDVSPYAITLTLSGLDATISGAALTEDYYLHGVTVYPGRFGSRRCFDRYPHPDLGGIYGSNEHDSRRRWRRCNPIGRRVGTVTLQQIAEPNVYEHRAAGAIERRPVFQFLAPYRGRENQLGI